MRHPPEAAGSDAVLVASASVTGSPPRETDERAFLVEDATMFASASQPARTRSHAAFTKLALEAAATEPARVSLVKPPGASDVPLLGGRPLLDDDTGARWSCAVGTWGGRGQNG